MEPATEIPVIRGKKRFLMSAGPLRQRLRSAGHGLRPFVQVGKEGLTPAALKQIQQALADHELIKLKLLAEAPLDRYELADALGTDSGVRIAQILGRTILAYKKHPETPRFE
jgi:RNA-binding protein